MRNKQNKLRFAVVGGDGRFAHLAGALAGHNRVDAVYGMFFDKQTELPEGVHRSNDIHTVLPQSDVVVFPLPVVGSDGALNLPLSGETVTVRDCLEAMRPGALALGGMVPDDMQALAAERGIELADYSIREEFAVLNAVPTAEGAVEIALRELPITLFRSRCLVIGYGRIARVLTELLRAFGADVTVAARKCSDLAWAQVAGARAIPLSQLNRCLEEGVDALFNTAPAAILGPEELTSLNRDCLLVDLASKPGGVDFAAAEQLGLKSIWALSLPGKCAPVSAGEIILQTICNILEERGII
ncbi:dipicolinate synthase subunit DpsA [Ruminococcaceae bacterium OttesenSCG-928-L11]|nr:dipicolinate synthase subunit DpsA [Ruminococcaceae bacterium OttesenSCG-928-L11]